ncbi:MAG TPA: hypothetical protein DEG17_03365 [Cyanobacteria bacterium UBA11149]|nr:hypothetical protein [Cyanobacteria bacterium UBA11367]HBR74245.1 hypothetical protein [Cyanobacteria bacterium UBA11159]HBS69858.1 hypothetical protein [Cyanobacteria bacterium UBA11153]HBW87946.1 hypothetical protein [Cyanobacteria bacterium UBA11149]
MDEAEKFISNIPLSNRHVLVRITDLKFPRSRGFAGTVRGVSLVGSLEVKSPYQNLYLNDCIQIRLFDMDDLIPFTLEFNPSFKLSHILFEAWEWIPVLSTNSHDFLIRERELLLPENLARKGLSIINYGDFPAVFHTVCPRLESIKSIVVSPRFYLPKIKTALEIWGEAEDYTSIQINELIEG